MARRIRSGSRSKGKPQTAAVPYDSYSAVQRARPAVRREFILNRWHPQHRPQRIRRTAGGACPADGKPRGRFGLSHRVCAARSRPAASIAHLSFPGSHHGDVPSAAQDSMLMLNEPAPPQNLD